jgi:hypothetical protein
MLTAPLHDLLCAHAAEQVRHTDSDNDRDLATGRVLDHYLHTAAGAALLIYPSMEPVPLAAPRPGAVPGSLLITGRPWPGSRKSTRSCWPP